ncbi:hypothetical protein COLO4_12642 [Corchorus olitorius]|uniref:Uncharacterized protein n=1 Tax=Corchorus olitorius TaxID=93759 RepID=A0A1R3K075_9ROSI|nr:hypothetical protein COLO4_12642 [Corchorus olitorius]
MGQTGHLIDLSCDVGRGTQWWERKSGPCGTVFALFPRGAAWWSLPAGRGWVRWSDRDVWAKSLVSLDY